MWYVFMAHGVQGSPRACGDIFVPGHFTPLLKKPRTFIYYIQLYSPNIMVAHTTFASR